MKKFEHKRVSFAQARSIQGEYNDKCGSTNADYDKEYINDINGKVTDCLYAKAFICNDADGVKVYWRQVYGGWKTDLTCYYDNFQCSGSLIWC
ncbi:hypothetical protein AB9P05_00865 [Roseivirga sp. BDSF3-8]|uniref:hypothetical protein n=1 Tax=Roseivirga sp. BDSF3-8 TaxID=3241598 RepID=UPI0035326890